jgi:hypothetical protein
MPAGPDIARRIVCYDGARDAIGSRREHGSWDLDMGDSYDQKPVPDLRVADVVGILFFVAISALFLYITGMWIYHLIVGR